MDEVSFDVEAPRGGWYSGEVGVRVNGVSLADLARAAEAPFAAAEGNPDLAGDYAPLHLADIRSDPRHFLGRPRASWFADGDTVLLGCTCGEWGCWPLTARVEVGPSVVRWVGFRNGHRDWDLSALGPFEFDRARYETALAAVG